MHSTDSRWFIPSLIYEHNHWAQMRAHFLCKIYGPRPLTALSLFLWHTHSHTHTHTNAQINTQTRQENTFYWPLTTNKLKLPLCLSSDFEQAKCYIAHLHKQGDKKQYDLIYQRLNQLSVQGHSAICTYSRYLPDHFSFHCWKRDDPFFYKECKGTAQVRGFQPFSPSPNRQNGNQPEAGRTLNCTTLVPQAGPKVNKQYFSPYNIIKQGKKSCNHQLLWNMVE